MDLMNYKCTGDVLLTTGFSVQRTQSSKYAKAQKHLRRHHETTNLLDRKLVQTIKTIIINELMDTWRNI